MVRTSALMASAAMLLTSVLHADDPPPLETKIESVGLFKNGLAVVRRSATLPIGAGNEQQRVFDITDLPEPVHGTFWVESTATLEISVTNADVPADDDAPLPAMTNVALKGSTVTVHFKSEHLPAITGRVATPPEPAKSWNKNYGWSRPTHQWWWSGYDVGHSHYQPAGAASAVGTLVLETDTGDVVLDVSTIAYLRVEEGAEAPTVRRPVLRVRVEDGPQRDIEVGILYLTKGASWAPSYEVAIDGSTHLTLRQSAVIRNELEDWSDVELLLISGFPNVEFGHVLSPMSPATNLASFFRALGTENRLSHSSRGDVMSQMVVSNMAATPALGTDAAEVEDTSLSGVDLFYHSVGKRSLKAGDAMLIETARGEATCERIVQLAQHDDRDAWGRRQSVNYSSQPEPSDDNQPWDAVRFRNPLSMPMTTGPAMVLVDGMMRGQSMVNWSAPGEKNLLRINKTLSVRGWINEIEREDSRDGVTRYGRKMRMATVDGTAVIVNQRAEPVTIVMRVEFSGDLLEAEGEPETSMRGEGVWSLNPRRLLTWTIELQPGEKRELTYSYTVLVPV